MRCTPLRLSMLVLIYSTGLAPAQEQSKLELVLQTRGSRPVMGVALSSDGKHVVTAYDQTAVLWDAAGGKELQTFQGQNGSISSLALSGDGKHIAIAQLAKCGATATLFEATGGKKIHGNRS